MGQYFNRKQTEMKFKKPFKETKVGKILTSGVARTALDMIPFGIGSTISQVLNKNDTPEGSISREALVKSLVKLGIYAVLLYLVFSGKLDMSDAQDYKEFIQN